jgi:GINS complex subunit 3
MALPLWLGGYLALQHFGDAPTMNIDLPPSLGPRVLNALKANPRTVDVRALAAHFYELAARSLELIEEDEIVDVLLEVRARSEAWRRLMHVDIQTACSGNC